MNMTKPDTAKIFTIPNLLSLFRLCLIPLTVWLYCSEQNDVWAGCILILSGLTDIVDGFIARHFHMTSDLGKVLDPIADKLTQAAMLICLLFRFPLMIWPFVVLALKEVFMSITGLAVIRKTGTVPGASWHGKAATCLLYAMMICHVFWSEIPALLSGALIAACTAMISLSFLLYGLRNIRMLHSQEHST